MHQKKKRNYTNPEEQVQVETFLKLILIYGYPIPVQFKIDCTDKGELNDTKVIKNLIEQVYQFSRMYWKSVHQQNLPVTIKYPEMVAQIDPHFNANDILEYSKTNLCFL